MIPGITVTLGGADYIVPPLSLGSLEMLQDKLEAFNSGVVSRESANAVIEAALAALKRNYPDMTRDKVANELLDLGNMLEVMNAIMDVSGIRRQKAEAGKAPAGESTGSSSIAT